MVPTSCDDFIVASLRKSSGTPAGRLREVTALSRSRAKRRNRFSTICPKSTYRENGMMYLRALTICESLTATCTYYQLATFLASLSEGDNGNKSTSHGDAHESRWTLYSSKCRARRLIVQLLGSTFAARNCAV